MRAAQQDASANAGDQIVETLAGEEAAPAETLSFSRRIALITQETAEGIAASAEAALAQLALAPRVFDGLDGSEAGVLLDALKELALIIVATVAVFLLLRRTGKALYARMGASAREAGVLRTAMLFVASALIDVAIVIIAWPSAI